MDTYGGKRISTQQVASLTRWAMVEEVCKAIFSMKKFGSPGPDEIQVVFYQNGWEAVKLSITNLVNMALRIGKAPKGFLEAFITLIPKKETPE